MSALRAESLTAIQGKPVMILSEYRDYTTIGQGSSASQYAQVSQKTGSVTALAVVMLLDHWLDASRRAGVEVFNQPPNSHARTDARRDSAHPFMNSRRQQHQA